MSTFTNNRFRWRETYFVLFDMAQRPSLDDLQKVFRSLGSRFEVRNLQVDDDGQFESATLLAPDAYSALDISFVSGEEVLEHSATLAEELEENCERSELAKLKRLGVCDGRFDVLHFEEVVENGEDDGMLDPAALLTVLNALVRLTDGLAVDPQANCFVV